MSRRPDRRVPGRVGMVDETTKKTLAAIPLLKTNSGPRDKENWVKRLKEEYAALIKVGHTRKTNFYVLELLYMYLCICICVSVCVFLQYVSNNKEQDNDWFRLESNAEGTRYVRMHAQCSLL